MDVLTLLKEDHARIKKILEEGESTTERGEKTRTELFHRLKTILTAHEAMEEEVLYPALKAHPQAKELTLEAYEEHHVVDLVMEELEATPVTDEQWGAKFTVAKENIEHHIEEEEGEMFKRHPRGVHARRARGNGRQDGRYPVTRQAGRRRRVLTLAFHANSNGGGIKSEAANAPGNFRWVSRSMHSGSS